MRVLVVSTSNFAGGAARAAYRLHQGLKSIKVESKMLVQLQQGDDQSVLGLSSSSGIAQINNGIRLSLDQMPLKLYRNRLNGNFSLQWLPDIATSKIRTMKPDVVNLHWINNGFIQIESLRKFGKPIVWTLHDMWPFTGGCYYSSNCDRYRQACGSCPLLSSVKDKDLSRWIWHRKIKAWKDLNLTVVSPSNWLADCAQSSSIFSSTRVEAIPNGINTNIYRPINKQLAREILGLPKDKYLILFGALKATSNRRKGFHLLQSALKNLSKSRIRDKLELVIFGSSQPENQPNFGFNTHYMGLLNDDISLCLMYSAADTFILPSIQENLSNTVMEALSCGVPSIAFNIGGMPEMIEHLQNGYLAQPFEVEDLAKGIVWVLENHERYQKLSFYARKKVEQQFTQEIQANRYTSLFSELIDEN